MYSSWHAIKILLADTKTMILSKKYICNLYHVKCHYRIKDSSVHLFFSSLQKEKEKVNFRLKDNQNKDFGQLYHDKILIQLLILISV